MPFTVLEQQNRKCEKHLAPLKDARGCSIRTPLFPLPEWAGDVKMRFVGRRGRLEVEDVK